MSDLSTSVILLFNAMACFEWNLHTQISCEDSILSPTFYGDHVVDTTFCSMTFYDITIDNGVARDVNCNIVMDHDIAKGAYHDVTMHADVAKTLIYYVLLYSIKIFLLS